MGIDHVPQETRLEVEILDPEEPTRITFALVELMQSSGQLV